MADSSNRFMAPTHPIRLVVSLLLLCMAGALGFAITFIDPIKFAVAIGGLGFCVFFLWAAIRFPVATLAVIVLAQILLPVYVRLPIPGSPPPALLLLAGLFAIRFALAIVAPSPYTPGRFEKYMAYAVLTYGILLFISLVFGLAPKAGLTMYTKTVIIPLIFFFMFLGSIRNTKQLEFLYKVIFFAAFACGILGVHEFATKHNVVANFFAPNVSQEEDYFLWYLVNARDAEYLPKTTVYRVFSFFTQPLEYSAFMIMSIPLAALWFVYAKTLTERLIYGLGGATMFAGFIVSFSRGPTLALAIVLTMLAFYEKKLRPWLLFMCFVCAAGLVAVWPKIAAKLTERVTGSENVTLRFSLWKNGIQTFLENPVLGIGYGSYPSYHVQSIRDHRIGPMYEFPWQHIERVTTMENIYITLAAETGIIGLSSFGIILWVFINCFSKVMKNVQDERSRILAMASFAGVFAYLLSGMTVANILGYTITIVFFGIYLPTIVLIAKEQLNKPV